MSAHRPLGTLAPLEAPATLKELRKRHLNHLKVHVWMRANVHAVEPTNATMPAKNAVVGAMIAIKRTQEYNKPRLWRGLLYLVG